MALQRMRYAVIHDNHAICDTEAPETVGALLKQRKRWMFGNFQVTWKNRAIFFRPKYGVLGVFAMPYAIAQLVLQLAFLPILVGVSGLHVANGDWKPVVGLAIFVFVMQTLIAVPGLLMVRGGCGFHLLLVVA